jgi:PAS domain S-box-containing protein
MDTLETVLPAPVSLRCGSDRSEHFVQFYADDDELVRLISDFMRGALDSGGTAIVIATQAHLAALKRHSSGRERDVTGSRKTGTFVALDAQQVMDALMAGGSPDPECFARTIESRIAAAAARDGPVAIYGEVVALLWAQCNYDAAVRVEALWNDAARRYDFSLLCGYPIALMKSGSWASISGVCASHAHAIPTRSPTNEERQLAEICEMYRRGREFDAAIGERDAARREGASRERELSDFLENAAIAIHSVGPDGTILWANQFELDMLGYAADEYIGQSIQRFYADPQTCADVLRRLSQGELLRDEAVQLRARDGSIRDVLVTSNVRFESGAFIQTRCFTRDVTEQRRMERALRESEARAEEIRALSSAIVESSEDAIISKSLEGRITSWNAGAQRLFGYEAKEAIGKPITIIIPPELHKDEQRILGKLRRGERIDHFETVRVAKDGRRLEVSLTISPVRDRNGRVIGASKVARDVSDRKRIEAQLREADRRKDEFIAMLGHELRNPLAPIRNVAEVLRRTSAGNATTERLCIMLERQVQQVTRLLDDLLDVTRITRGTIKFRRDCVDLGHVVNRALEAARPLADGRRHVLRVDVPKDPMYVRGDGVRLVQMLTNLLNNAAKYTKTGGRIGLTVSRQDDRFELRVNDNGVGITSEMLPRIFDLFVQAGRSESEIQEGLGIGLTLVRVIAERHGGTVAARSEGLGRGSEFVVTLPAAADGAQPETIARAADVRPAGRKRILIVDDNRDASESLATLLRLSGHDVFVEVEAQAVAQRVESLRPDLALLDIGLPGMDGYEIARRLRAGGFTTPLAALTGYGSPEDRERARQAGFDHHFVKPIDPLALERLLATLP